MTAFSPYAVSYKNHGDDLERHIFAATPHEQGIHLRNLLQNEGIVGEAVEFTVIKDVTLAYRVAREFVEDTVKEYLEGERDLDEVNDMLRPLSPGLLEDGEATAIRADSKDAFIDGCVRTIRIEELANLMDRAAKAGGLQDLSDRDLDAIEAQRDWLIRVLAGQMEHSGSDHPCHRCAMARPCGICAACARPAIRDLDAPETTETSEEAA